MKNLIIILLTLIAFSASAEKPDGPDCQALYNYAEKLMKGRQHGVPLKAALDANKRTYPELQILVKAAYRQPRHESEIVRRNVIKTFASNIYSVCLNQHK